jgi:hypothetical protein
MLRCVVDGEAEQPGMQLRFLAQRGDAFLGAALELAQPGDHLPHIRSRGERGAPVVGGSAEHDSGEVELLDALDDEPFDERRGADAVLCGAGSESPSGGLADAERRACCHQEPPARTAIVAHVRYKESVDRPMGRRASCPLG